MQVNTFEMGLGGGKLWQFANRSIYQMMSYIIDCPDGKTVVIDGGNYCKEDGDNLRAELKKRGGKVDFWVITHAHSDHLGAMLYLMEQDLFDIEVGALCFRFPDSEWLMRTEEREWETGRKFLELYSRYVKNIITPNAGDVFEVGGIRIKILSVPEDYADYPNVNSTSLILRICFPKRDVLFLGDFDRFSEQEFLTKHSADDLQCDIVQMAHHGQDGVTEDFYKLIQPKICLYTAPKWLWENNYYKCEDPKTAGMGPFTIMETRSWMEKAGVEHSFHFADGDWMFF